MSASDKKRIQELESKVFDLDRDSFEAKTFLRIAEEKLSFWVKKHDKLLIKYKKINAKKKSSKK